MAPRTLTINRSTVQVPEGATVLEAATQAGVTIPTLCHARDLAPGTSCMLCVVEETTTGRLLASCSAPVEDGMVVETDNEHVRRARQDVLELLLSEHVGDCEAPCSRICPAHLDIPLMLRQLARGREEEAAWIAQRDLALPTVLAHVCTAPCENGCRRKEVDRAITIQALHNTGAPFRAPFPVDPLRSVAVRGSGPAGLACAWTLRLAGYDCVVVDEAVEAGGVLAGLDETELPRSVLDADLAVIREAGVVFRLGQLVDTAALQAEFDAVVVAGPSGSECPEGVFFAEERSLVVGAVGRGKAAARQVDRCLRGIEPHQAPKRFDSRIGSLAGAAVKPLLGNCPTPVSTEPAPVEAARCLHCDCRNVESCQLRQYADSYRARQRRFPAPEAVRIELHADGGDVVFESGKCIKCGLCIRLTEREDADWGMTFLGRGFDTRVGTPFGISLRKALEHSARACVEICPTGALAFRDTEEREI